MALTLSDDIRASVHELEVKRGSRRGNVTKIHNRIVKAIADDPDRIQASSLQVLSSQLSAAIDTHQAIQAQLEEFYESFAELRSASKEAEDTDLLDTHVEWKASVANVLVALPLRRQAISLLSDIEAAISSPMPDSPFYRNSVDRLHGRRVSVVDSATEYFRDMPDLQTVCGTVVDRMNHLFTMTAAACKEAAAPAPLFAPAPATPTSDRHLLNIELPSFDGDPFKWANFRTMFTRTVDKRARGHSPLEVKGLLIKAIKPQEGLHILHNLPSDDTSLKEMLDRLEAVYGTPEIIAPLIISKIRSVTACSLSLRDMDRVYEDVILPFRKFCAVVGDSLGSFIAMSVSGFMTQECRREWLRHRSPGSQPDMDNLSQFIDLQRRELRGASTHGPTSTPHLPLTTPARPPSPRTDRTRPAPGTSAPPRRTTLHCTVCGDQHSIIRCPTFAAYDVDKRNQVIRSRKLCLNCFADGHGCKLCPSRFSCRSCNGRHHSLLHRGRENTNGSSSAAAPTPAPVLTASSAPAPRGVASLYTALISFEVGDRTVLARALLDAGASTPLMSESLAATLRLPRKLDPIPITGIAGSTECKYVVTCNVCSVDRRYKLPDVAFTLIPALEPIPKPTDTSFIHRRPELRHFSLADSDLGGRVDLVLGITQTSALTTGAPFRVGELLALPTQLGLCLSAPLDHTAKPSVNTVTSQPSLVTDLSRLWELDRVPELSPHSPEEQAALDSFQSTHTRVDGRYSVSLPRVTSPSLLGDSRAQALSRLHSNERSLNLKGKLPTFHNVISEYFDMGHAELVPIFDIKKPAYYMPVHAVSKETSTSTKLRAVFDASARTATGCSLNDQLLAGPNLYPPLLDVLVRFRGHAVAVSADISKMFREILLNEEERDWHRFLARMPDNSIRDARMRRLTFGVKSSPFLATQVLRQHADNIASSYPSAASCIRQDFYVDDVLTGAPTTSDAYDLFCNLRSALLEAGMSLRKWRSNDPELRKLIPDDLLETESHHIANDSQKALGVHWDTVSDALHVAIPDLSSEPAHVTKRHIASVTAGVFDVLGLFCPVVIVARILFQDTWRLGLSWDEDVPPDLIDRWKDWVSDLPRIHSHPVHRRIFPSSAADLRITLHGFCDASNVAYGVAIYVRCQSAHSPTSTALVLAKARVLPTRPMTTPKAELAGALLLAQLLAHVVKLLNIPLHDVYAWTDSSIVLHWLPKSPTSLHRFVMNRVATIQDLLPAQHWRHVPTTQNPADLASRGVRAADLRTSDLWWHGPPWLVQVPEQWPPPFRAKPTAPFYSVSIKPPLDLPESQSAFLCNLVSIRSSFLSLVRVLCYVFRFTHNCNSPANQCLTGPLTPKETSFAKSTLYRLAQLQSFPDAFPAAHKNLPLPKGHALQRYHLKLSATGHLIALSRVRNPDAPTAPAELIPLSAKSAITRLLLSSLHRSYGHPGTSTLLAILSTSFALIGARNFLRGVSRQCVTCQRVLAQPVSQVMGLLPAVRTTPAPPFGNTGVDFAGPVTLRVGHTRKPVHIKAYIAVFVCMATKATHFELCESLSTADFLACFKRFIARRGCPTHVYSDNGTNFVGAAEEIRAIARMTKSEIHQTAISAFCTSTNITWHHTPPRAPHFGGLWEAAVKAMKMGIRKIIAPHPLTWSELTTVLAEVEATLNSRPISPLHADDLEEDNVLTPGHFLVGRPLRALPSKLPSTGKISLLRRWNLTERLNSDLWRTWSSSYLASCAARAKWLRPGNTFQVGDIVLLRDDTLRTRTWPLARILELHPGDDGVSRVATLRCRGKTYTRHCHRLVHLVTDSDEDKQASSSAPLLDD